MRRRWSAADRRFHSHSATVLFALRIRTHTSLGAHRTTKCVASICATTEFSSIFVSPMDFNIIFLVSAVSSLAIDVCIRDACVFIDCSRRKCETTHIHTLTHGRVLKTENKGHSQPKYGVANNKALMRFLLVLSHFVVFLAFVFFLLFGQPIRCLVFVLSRFCQTQWNPVCDCGYFANPL